MRKYQVSSISKACLCFAKVKYQGSFNLEIFKPESGQALVTLVVFVAMAVIVTTAAVAVSVINTQTTSQFSQGQQAYDLAEAGVEDAILKLVRNASFDSPSPGYTITVGTNTIQVIVTPPGQVTSKTIVSRGVVNNRFKRKIQVTGQFNTDGTFSIVSWNEVDD